MKFLIIRFSSIGDVVLTTPVIRCLKKQVASAKVHYLTKPNFANILVSNPYIDKVHLLEEDFGALIQKLRAERYDAVIDLHHNMRSARVKWNLKTRSSSFNKLNIEKWLMVKFKINKLPDSHIVDRYLEAVAGYGVVNDFEGLDYFIPAKDEVDLSDLPFRDYTAIVIGAAHNTKKLPVHKLIELALAIQGPIVLLGGKEDAPVGEQISTAAPERIFSACGKFNLNQSASLLQQAKSVISHDTGLMHIAAALRKPIVSVWGNTIPAFGMYPYEGGKQAVNISEVKDLSCRPCSKIGYDKCPLGHFKCMEMQDVKAIAASAGELGA